MAALRAPIHEEHLVDGERVALNLHEDPVRRLRHGGAPRRMRDVSSSPQAASACCVQEKAREGSDVSVTNAAQSVRQCVC